MPAVSVARHAVRMASSALSVLKYVKRVGIFVCYRNYLRTQNGWRPAGNVLVLFTIVITMRNQTLL